MRIYQGHEWFSLSDAICDLFLITFLLSKIDANILTNIKLL